MAGVVERFAKGTEAEWYNPQETRWVRGRVKETDGDTGAVTFYHDDSEDDTNKPRQVPPAFVRHIPAPNGHLPPILATPSDLEQLWVEFPHPDTIGTGEYWDTLTLHLTHIGVRQNHRDASTVDFRWTKDRWGRPVVIVALTQTLTLDKLERLCDAGCSREDCGAVVQRRQMATQAAFASFMGTRLRNALGGGGGGPVGCGTDSPPGTGGVGQDNLRGSDEKSTADGVRQHDPTGVRRLGERRTQQNPG